MKTTGKTKFESKTFKPFDDAAGASSDGHHACGMVRKMYQDRIVLCGSSAYTKKYYLNEDFENLPQKVKDELQIMCVLYTEDVGGILTLVFEEDGTLEFEASADEGDLLFDEIGSVLKIKQMRNEKQDLLEALEMYFKVFFLGEDAAEEPETAADT